MDDFSAYFRDRARWAGKGNGGICGWLSLVIGAILAALLLCFPKWTREHVSDTMNVVLVGLVPLAAGASVFLVRWVYSAFAVFKVERDNVRRLEERLATKLTVEYKADGQCNLYASPKNEAHFRVRLYLDGEEIVRNLIATVKAIRRDGLDLLMTEAVRLRFHNASSDVLETMNPGTPELLDILRMDNGNLSLAVARRYNSFDCYCCNRPGDYEVDVYIGSSSPRVDFTFGFQWTGNYKTTAAYIKLPLSVPNMATSQRLPT